jgi:hypothetical protein
MVYAGRDGIRPTQQDGELDSLLVAWADAHHLTDAKAEAIRKAAMVEPAAASALGYSWWADLFADTAAVLRRSVDLRTYLPGVTMPPHRRSTLSSPLAATM